MGEPDPVFRRQTNKLEIQHWWWNIKYSFNHSASNFVPPVFSLGVLDAQVTPISRSTYKRLRLMRVWKTLSFCWASSLALVLGHLIRGTVVQRQFEPSWLLFPVALGKSLYRRVLPGLAVKDIVWLNNSTSAIQAAEDVCSAERLWWYMIVSRPMDHG